MPVATPHNVPLSGTPAWFNGATTLVNAALAAPWGMGDLARDLTFTAAQLSLAAFTPAMVALVELFLNEYRAAGWRITLIGAAPQSGPITSITYRFWRADA